MEVKVTVGALYELRALLYGFEGIKKNGEAFKIPPFVDSNVITEGTRRIANKIAKKITAEITGIDEQMMKISSKKVEDDAVFESDEKRAEAESALEEEKKKLTEELLSGECTFTLEETLDFKKLENLTFQWNYTFLFETVASNYN